MSGSAALASIVTPIDVLISGLVEGLIQQANAATTPSALPPRRYIVVYLDGGPPRWGFDGPLNPYSDGSGLATDPSVVSRFRSSGGSTAGSPEYGTVPITRQGVTLNMPQLWACNIPTAGGGSVPMASLLDNMVMMRGIDMITDGHAADARKQIRPIASSPSLDGMVSDRSSAPLPAVAVGYYGIVLTDAYRSAKGIGITGATPSDGILSQLLRPFDRSQDGLSGAYMSRRMAMDTALNQALASLGSYAKSVHPGAENLYAIRSSAEAVLRKGIGDLSGVYSYLVSKYRNLITAAATSPIPGITDKAISISGLPRDQNGFINQTTVNGTDDGGPIASARNSDLRTMIGSSFEIGYLAESMAVAEYLITQGYSTSVQCQARIVGGLYCEDQISMTDGSSIGNRYRNWSFDEHYGGSWTSLLVNSTMYRALSACLYEMIAVLKSKGLFNETVIHVTSEFNRSPGGAGPEGGSNHSPSSTVNSVLCGAIDKPYVLGNIDSSAAFGAAATVNVDGASAKLGIGHSTSTVAQLLRVDHPLQNNSSLLIEKPDGSGVLPTIELAKNK